LNPNSLSGASPVFHLSAKYFRGKNTETPTDGTVLFTATASTPLDLFGVNTFSQPTAANRPLYKTTEGFKTINFADNNDNIRMINTLFKNCNSAFYCWYGKIESHVAGTFSNIIVTFQNPLGNGARFVVYLDSTAIRFVTNINDASNTGANTLTYTEQVDLEDKYVILCCFQDYVGGVKKMWLNNRLVASTTTSFGAAVPNTNTAFSYLGNESSSRPIEHQITSACVINCSEPTTEEIRKINNFLIHS